MAKEAYYFSHDSNAGQDPKIVQMISVYGYQGYGWYWRFIEMMREQEDHRLCVSGKYAYHGFAKALLTEPDNIRTFINDCIDEFHLFSKNGDYFWSDSLNRRIQLYEDKKAHYVDAGKRGAQARWGTKNITTPITNNNNAIYKNGNANGDPKEINSIKGKEIKGKESKEDKEASFKKYTDDLRLKYNDLNFDNELEKFHLYWSEGKRKLKRPRLALKNWMDKAREIRKERQDGTHQSRPGKIPTRYTRPEELLQ